MKFFRRRPAFERSHAAAIPEIRGHLDRFDNGRLQGWAANTSDHSAHISIEVVYRDKVLQVQETWLERNDVNDAGIAGNHGFDFLLNGNMKDCVCSNELEIRAKCKDTSIKLIGVSMEKICSFLRHDGASGSMRPCDVVWGAELERADPALSIYHDAVFVPFKPHTFIDTNNDWGLYSADGRLIEEAAYRRGADHSLVGQSQNIDLAELEIKTAPYATMVYGGPIIAHYGHFLLTSLARSWALDGCVPALYHSDPPIHEHQSSFVRQIFEVAGITPQNSFSFDRPTRITTLLVPEAALIEQHSVSRHYTSAMAAISRNVQSLSTTAWDKIYLSKERLRSGVSRLDGEAYVSRKLSDAGFHIVYPEQLTLAEQIDIFRKARVIVGTAGSAFHTQCFVRREDIDRIVLSYDRFINSNFKLLDKVSGGRSHYMSIAEHVSVSDEENFQAGYRLNNASYFADELIAFVDSVLLDR